MKHTYIYTVLMALLSIVLTIWVVMTMQTHEPLIDRQLVNWVQPLEQTRIYHMAHWVTKLGSKIFLIPFTMIMSLVFLWRYRDWFVPFIFAGGTLLSHILNQLIKHLVQRDRPSIAVAFDATGYSFPSGHAMISIVCYGLFLYFLLNTMSTSTKTMPLKLTICVLIICIGLSRVMLNVHYMTDVIAGFAFGFVWLQICKKLYRSFGKS